MRKKIYLSPPHMGNYELHYIKQAFDENWIAPVGPHITAFENELAEYVGANGAVALSSGTAAIHLALRLLDVKEGDIIFCSSLTFIASVSPVIYQRATPVFIDSEPQSWNMSPRALQYALEEAEKKGKLPKAVIVVNLYGQSADMDPILELCDHYDIPIIEDAAESLGAIYKGRSSGTFGEFGIYSFNGNKIITTSGGGMLVSKNLEALEQARFLATQARDPALHYQHSVLGYNYRMSNILAGIGRGQLLVLNEYISKRRKIFERYYEALYSIEGISFMPEVDGGRSTRWLTAMTIDPDISPVSAAQLVEELNNNGIESRPIWKPLHMQPIFQDKTFYPHSEKEKISESLFATGLCLPSGSNLSYEDQGYIINCIKKRLAQKSKI